MDCFACSMLIRKYGLRNFCDLRNRQLSIKELRKSCKRLIDTYPNCFIKMDTKNARTHNHHEGEKEKGYSGCLHHFGYLANHDVNVPIPEECLICPNVSKCMRMRIPIRMLEHHARAQ